MSTWADDALELLERFAARAPLPRVRALHLPPPPAPDGLRGEFCALELDDGALGLAYVLLGDTLETLRRADVRLEGADPLALARGFGSGDLLHRTLGFAAMNALTRCLFERAGFAPPRSADSFGGLDPRPGATLGMVGYFAPLVGRLVERGARLVVVELREDLVRDDGTVRITTDPRELAGCRRIMATGTLMLNDSLEHMLPHCRGAEHLALVGPSVGAPPDPLFARGVTLLGGHWVHEGAGFVDALMRGEPTAPFAWKSALARDGYPGWDALLARL
jgi:uncharacterized protein (DUF4213/DUF364 family)